MSARLCIDLCSGLGGFSQAFVDAGWEVVRIDIERRFRPTIQADVNYLPLREGIEPDVLLAGPDCRYFSVAGLPYGFPRKGTGDALRLIASCVDAVSYLKAKAWLMENPGGMLRVFIGKGQHQIRMSDYGARYKKPTDLWGNVPFPLLDESKDWEKAPKGTKCGLMAKEIRNPAERAKIPYGLSQAILDAISPAVAVVEGGQR